LTAGSPTMTTSCWGSSERMQAEPFFHLTVEGAPIAKGRPRMTKRGTVYTPEKTRRYERLIAELTRLRMGARLPTENPCIVHVAAMFEIPHSWTVKRKMQTLAEGGFHTSKPDLDNVAKSAIDGICGERGAILDDKQIVELCAFKSYGGMERLMIDVFEVHNVVDRFSNRWRAWESGEVAVGPV
jgi:Holliday junction resolvase RusA-like endonuclease